MMGINIFVLLNVQNKMIGNAMRIIWHYTILYHNFNIK